MDSFTPHPEQDPRKLEAPKDTSALKFYSMAIVVKTPKSFPSTLIEVTPIESLSIQSSGKLAQADVTYKQTHGDASGSFDSQKDVSKNNVIEAHWLPFSDSNRATPPCVYQDESVILFKYADVQKYYWATIKHQPELRRKEMVRWSASNESAPLTPYTKETSYFTEFNALTKKLEIGTPVNGEGVAYRILLDVGAGQLDIADNVGNSIVLNSTQGTITATATKSLVVNAGAQIELNAPTTTINSSVINLNGAVSVSKGIGIAQGLTVAGGGGGKAATIGGDLYVKGSFSAQKINSDSITESGYIASDVSVKTAQNQSAQSASAPAALTSSTSGSAPAAPAPTPTPTPAPTDKSYKVDAVATANTCESKLTGNTVLDAPKLASGEIAKTHTQSIPGITSIKESAAKIGVPGQQLADKQPGSGNLLQGLVSSARAVQGTLSTATSKASTTAQTATSSIKSTVMDPINGLTRQVGDIFSQSTSVISLIDSSVSNQVNGFLQPLNSISQSLRGKPLTNANLNAFSSKLSGLSYKVNTLSAKTLSPVNNLSNSLSERTYDVTRKVDQATYAAYNFTEPLRQATDTTESVQKASEQAAKQLKELAPKAS